MKNIIAIILMIFTANLLSQVQLTGENQYRGVFSPPSSLNKSNAITLDNSGNVYVTGQSDNINTGTGIVTVCYNSTLVTQNWAQRYTGNAGNDAGYSIAYDEINGKIYVCGTILGNGSGYDYITIQYTTGGSQGWTNTYSGTGNGDDIANHVEVDASGNVYVTGQSWNGNDFDYATVKYNPSGQQQWVSRYDGGNGNDTAKSIKVDGDNGYVYVTGSSAGNGTGLDFATVRYASDGTQLWVNRYNGAANHNDWANDLAVDKNLGVYVCGCSESNSNDAAKYTIVKYSNSGTQAWVVNSYRWRSQGNFAL